MIIEIYIMISYVLSITSIIVVTLLNEYLLSKVPEYQMVSAVQQKTKQ